LKKQHDKTARMMMAEQLKTKVAQVDASKYPEIAKQYNITRYPALKYFVKGKFSTDYDGKNRDNEWMSLWLKNKEDPPFKELQEDELENFVDDLEDDTYALVAHVKQKSVRAKVLFKAVEDTLREWEAATISFAVVWLPKDADPKADAKLSMHRPGIRDPDPERIDYTGVWSEEKLIWWVQNGTYATVGKKFTRAAYAPMSMDAMKFGAAFVGVTDDATIKGEEDPKDEPLKPKLLEALIPHAQENPSWKFVIAEIEKIEEHEHELLGLKLGDEPRYVVLHDRKKYQLVGEDDMLDENKVREFISDIKAKKIKPHHKSAPDPEDEYDTDGSLVVTGNTFDDLVINAEDSDVFVEFYAPWCKHCQKLAPEWKKLAKKVEETGWKEKGVIIAKMDMGANECDEEVPHFPKMVLYPAVKAAKKYIKKMVFSGGRNADDLLDFVASNARNLQDEEGEEEDEEEIPKKRRRKGRKKDAAEL